MVVCHNVLRVVPQSKNRKTLLTVEKKIAELKNLKSEEITQWLKYLQILKSENLFTFKLYKELELLNNQNCSLQRNVYGQDIERH